MKQKTAAQQKSSLLMPFRALRRTLAVAGIAGFLSQGFAPCAHAGTFTTDISTTNGNWTITTDGLVNAAPYYLTQKYTTFNYLIGITADGFSTGNFLPGGNPATFDGYWTANYNFYLPANAAGVMLNYSGLFADDRVVLELNGHIIDSTAFINAPGSQFFTFTDGGPLTPWVFDTPDGAVGGSISSWFNLGGENTLTAILNNSGNGGLDGDVNVGTGDETTFGLLGNLTYTTVVPEPAPLTVFGLGGLALLLAIARRR